MRCKSEERGLKKQPLSADKSLPCRRHKDRVLRQDSAQSSAVNHSLLGLFRRAWAMDRQPPTYQLFTSYNFRDQEPPKAPLNFRCPPYRRMSIGLICFRAGSHIQSRGHKRWHNLQKQPQTYAAVCDVFRELSRGNASMLCRP